MSNIPTKPRREDFTNLTNFKAHQFDELGFAKADRNYERARAERAIEALDRIEFIARCNGDYMAASTCLKSIQEHAEKALSELNPQDKRES